MCYYFWHARNSFSLTSSGNRCLSFETLSNSVHRSRNWVEHHLYDFPLWLFFSTIPLQIPTGVCLYVWYLLPIDFTSWSFLLYPKFTKACRNLSKWLYRECMFVLILALIYFFKWHTYFVHSSKTKEHQADILNC